MIRHRVTLVVLALALPGPVLGQGLPVAGERVRVSRPHFSTATRTVTSVSNGELTLVQDGSGAPSVIQLDGTWAVEKSVGSTRDFLAFFSAGGGGSALAGGLIGAATANSDCAPGPWAVCPGPAAGFALGMVAGAIVGVPIGVILGLTLTREVWAPVHLPGVRGRSLSVRPVLGNGVGFIGSLSVG